MAKTKPTPVRRQYLEIKRQYPEAIVFFRLGDFYETFDEDAETVSRVLDIVLTSRNAGGGVRVPMAGIPHHAAENYLSRLIDAGHHVAICEQVGDHPVNGLMPRDVVRVVTPGTILEQDLLPGDANNYLGCILIEEKRAGVAYVDITTGEFSVTELSGGDIRESVRSELLRLHPAETLFPDSMAWSETNTSAHYTAWPAWRFEKMRCESVLKEQFNVESLDGFGVRGHPLAIRAAGAVVQYLGETRPEALKLLSSLSTYSLTEFMTLDAATRRNLELTETIRGGTAEGSLLGVLDCTVTPMGKRLLRRWVSKPLLDVSLIRKRHDGVEFFFTEGLLRAEMREELKSLNDLERLVNRVAGGTAQPRDLVAIRATLEMLPDVRDLLPAQLPEDSSLGEILANFSTCSPALNLLTSALQDDPPATVGHLGIIRQGYSEELDEVMESTRHAREWIANLESVEQERTGINSLKVSHNKVYGYYIEVTKAKADYVPDDYIRKQTLVNAERYVTPELKEYETKVLNAEEQIQEIERRLFYDLCQQLSRYGEEMLKTARVLAHWDTLAALAETAALNGYVRPEVVEGDVLDVRDGRHPVVEHTLAGKRFVPNDTTFEEGERIRIITGPNMSGKSTFLRQVALIALLAQMGSFVPAKSARIGLVDRIFTRIGAQDEIHAGQSTFMVEMVETANILNHATPRSLLILDEIGRGTSTYDGVAIAWAMVEYLHNHPQKRSKTLFATHYHELTQLSDLLPGVRNYNVAVSEAEGDVVFLYNIVPGGADQSYGIHVAQLAGVPGPVVQRAEEIMRQLEKSSGKAVKIDPQAPQQMALFPETNPLVEELEGLDLNELSPLEALNRLYEWQKKFVE
ncbi:MAG: DNA mismatch repair protein MutS [Chloroflexi bacterium]|nr:DNA mismatch repair protein MutS [Chloroflexota bacterium]